MQLPKPNCLSAARGRRLVPWPLLMTGGRQESCAMNIIDHKKTRFSVRVFHRTSNEMRGDNRSRFGPKR